MPDYPKPAWFPTDHETYANHIAKWWKTHSVHTIDETQPAESARRIIGVILAQSGEPIGMSRPREGTVYTSNVTNNWIHGREFFINASAVTRPDHPMARELGYVVDDQAIP